MSFFNDSFNYSLYVQMQDQIPAMNEFKQTSPQLQQYWFSIEIFGGRHSGGQLWNEVTALWNIYIYNSNRCFFYFSLNLLICCADVL